MINTSEHLQKILAKCRADLALAEKRSAGRWGATHNNVDVIDWGYGHSIAECCCEGTQGHSDADFVAACAGAAEAGWRSTIAAIEELRFCYGKPDDVFGNRAVAAICAAWPIELL